MSTGEEHRSCPQLKSLGAHTRARTRAPGAKSLDSGHHPSPLTCRSIHRSACSHVSPGESPHPRSVMRSTLRRKDDRNPFRGTCPRQYAPGILTGVQDQPGPDVIQSPFLHFRQFELAQFQTHWSSAAAVHSLELCCVVTCRGQSENVPDSEILHEATAPVLWLEAHLAIHSGVRTCHSRVLHAVTVFFFCHDDGGYLAQLIW